VRHRKQSRSWKDFAKEKDCTKLTILRLGISKNYTVGISQVFDIPNFISQLRFGNYCAFGILRLQWQSTFCTLDEGSALA